MRAALVLLAVLLASATFAALLALPSAAQTITLRVDGPRALAPNQAGQYNVTILGAPAEAVNYTVRYWITGTNLTGGKPPSNDTGLSTGVSTVHSMNITAPQAEQTITLIVQVSGNLASGSELNSTAEIAIVVVRPIVLTATFHNGASTAALNVTVRIRVDDALVGTTKIARIGANADASLTYNYLPVGLQPGEHSVRMEADLNGNGIIESSLGEVVLSDFFYEGVSPPSAGWSLVLGMAVFVPVFLGIVAYRRRSQR